MKAKLAAANSSAARTVSLDRVGGVEEPVTNETVEESLINETAEEPVTNERLADDRRWAEQFDTRIEVVKAKLAAANGSAARTMSLDAKPSGDYGLPKRP